ncbi:MAG: hypothetical protein K6G81_03690 [Lachnospiraceae bacterium]|nr:hypothetical protein [Lachnospiraceae bacterium]
MEDTPGKSLSAGDLPDDAQLSLFDHLLKSQEENAAKMSDSVNISDDGSSGMVQGGFGTRHEQLDFLASQGFEVVERVLVDGNSAAGAVESFSSKIAANDFPSDGLVLVYDDIAYGNSLGRTAKFPRDAIAFKWADEQAETTLREVEWSASRTGLINPVAIFDPVELEGTTVSRASLHNISIMEELKLGIGDRITVYKANMIIPQIADNLTKSGSFRIYEPPEDSKTGLYSEPVAGILIENSVCRYINPVVAGKCPVCGASAMVRNENDVRTLICPNPDCAAKKIKLFTLAVSRDALNVDGLSESTVEKFVDAGLICDTADIFRLKEHRETIEGMEGFGKKSCDNLLDAIEKARSTTLDRVIYALGIPNIGLANARLIAKYAEYDPERIPMLTADELSGIDQIGPVLAGAFTAFFADTGAGYVKPASGDRDSDSTTYAKKNGRRQYEDLIACLDLTVPQMNAENGAFAGKTFVITGSVEHFANRNEVKAYIESKGGKVTGSVTKNTDYLINNDVNSTSTKNKTARELGVAVISEDELLAMG